MPKKPTGLTDHPFDRLKDQEKPLKGKIKKTKSNNPPFLELNDTGEVIINYFDKLQGDYIEVKTQLELDTLERLSVEEIDQIAFDLLEGNRNKAVEKYQFSSVELPIRRRYELEGIASVKRLDVGIFATSTQDERALHYLLDKVRATL